MPNAQDELMDILSLSRNINTDIQEFNKNASIGSTSLRATMVDPKKAAGELAARAAREAGANIRPTVPPVQMVQTLDGHMVPAPLSFIPMPDGYTLPPPVPQTTVPRRTPPPLPPSAFVLNEAPMPEQQASDPRQLEFPFDVKGRRYSNTIEYFEERYNRIEAKFDIINGKLNELLAKQKRRYERKSTEKLD